MDAEMAAVRADMSDAHAEQHQRQCGLSDVVVPGILLSVCSFLGARELGRMARVSRCFGAKLNWPSTQGHAEEKLMWSMMEEVAEEDVRVLGELSSYAVHPSYRERVG